MTTSQEVKVLQQEVLEQDLALCVIDVICVPLDIFCLPLSIPLTGVCFMYSLKNKKIKLKNKCRYSTVNLNCLRMCAEGAPERQCKSRLDCQRFLSPRVQPLSKFGYFGVPKIALITRQQVETNNSA